MEAAWPTITAVIGVGVGLAGLIWQLQRETSKRIENLAIPNAVHRNGFGGTQGLHQRADSSDHPRSEHRTGSLVNPKPHHVPRSYSPPPA